MYTGIENLLNFPRRFILDKTNSIHFRGSTRAARRGARKNTKLKIRTVYHDLKLALLQKYSCSRVNQSFAHDI